jgi:aminoglycoside N3'-acetyltransferase
LKSFFDDIRKALRKNDSYFCAPILVHADIFRAKALVANSVDPELILSRHMKALNSICRDSPLFIPAFNYDFVQSGVYRPDFDCSQVGALSEYARTRWATQRCGPPIINFSCAVSDALELSCVNDTDPYGVNTIFGLVHRAGGKVLMYGAPFSSFTFIHYIERLLGGPSYRYDKYFHGVVRSINKPDVPVRLKYHCRPIGRNFSYDWSKLQKDAELQGAINSFKTKGSEILIVDLGLICELWGEKVISNPLYFLDRDTSIWVDRELNRLGRKFEIRDFEEID